MLGADLQATMTQAEQDEVLAHYVKDAAIYRRITMMYVARYGVLPELGGPQPEPPAPAVAETEPTVEAEAESAPEG